MSELARVCCDTTIAEYHDESCRQQHRLASRLSWEEYALELARTAARRSEDPYVTVGACVLREDRTVAALGYNGAPAGVVMDWSDRDARRLWVIHAEVNALRLVRPGEGSLIATTLAPCVECLKMIAAQRIRRVVFGSTTERYDTNNIEFIAKAFNIELVQL